MKCERDQQQPKQQQHDRSYFHNPHAPVEPEPTSSTAETEPYPRTNLLLVRILNLRPALAAALASNASIALALRNITTPTPPVMQEKAYSLAACLRIDYQRRDVGSWASSDGRSDTRSPSVHAGSSAACTHARTALCQGLEWIVSTKECAAIHQAPHRVTDTAPGGRATRESSSYFASSPPAGMSSMSCLRRASALRG